MISSSDLVVLQHRIEDLSTANRVICGLVGGICLFSVVVSQFLVVFFPLINGQASSPRRLSNWRRCPTVAWFARSQACYVLTVLTNFWCCVSNLLCIYSGTDHRALEAGGVVHDENHVHAGKRFFCRIDFRLCCFLIHIWCSGDEPPRKRFCKSPALVRFTMHVNQYGEMIITDLPDSVADGGPAIPWSCLSLYCRFIEWKMKWMLMNCWSVHWWGVCRVAVRDVSWSPWVVLVSPCIFVSFVHPSVCFGFHVSS